MQVSTQAIKFGVASLLAGLLIWRILVVGMSDFYSDKNTPEGAIASLGWRSTQPQALYQRAQSLSETKQTTAESIIREAVWADPTNALAYLALADLLAGSGHLSEAMRLVETADLLGPMRTPALAQSAFFWFKSGRPDLGIEGWSALLRSNPVTADQVFPSLLLLADNKVTRRLLQPLLNRPPNWWDDFFAYAAANAPQPETVSVLYQGRNRFGTLPSLSEQRVYLDRLWKDGLWSEAYLAWLGGLNEVALPTLGLVFNGGFEIPISGIGYDWHIATVEGATVETEATYGSSGLNSLHVVLAGLNERFMHVQQPLFLAPGRYRLSGRVRPDGLMPRQALRWVLLCSMAKGQPQAATDSFSGKDDWQVFNLEFEIPKVDCPIQTLRLEQEPHAASHGTVSGGVWFDDLSIERR
jgi:hypothetical protein